MEDNQITSRRPSWLSPHLSWKLLLVLALLCLNALGNVLSAFVQLQTGNLSGAAIYIFTAALYLLPAYGLFKLKNWARLLQLTLSILFVVQGIVVMINGYMFLGMINVVLHGLTAIYLLSDECRKLFKKAA
jgi:hypothetical protein